jgi:hypothetical protein
VAEVDFLGHRITPRRLENRWPQGGGNFGLGTT